jgi:hypothetical protein
MGAVTLVKTHGAVFRPNGNALNCHTTLLVKELKIPSALWMDGYLKIRIFEI